MFSQNLNANDQIIISRQNQINPQQQKNNNDADPNPVYHQQQQPLFLMQHCLLYDFHCIFSKGQTILQNVKGGSIRLEGALLLSKRYKAAIKRAVKMLEQSENLENHSPAAIQQSGEELCSTYLLWSLIEAVSIRPSHNLLSIDLLEWARDCFPSAQSTIPSEIGENIFLGSIMEELMQDEHPEQHDAYWNAVFRQMLCGDFHSVTTLLQFHSLLKEDEALAKMVKLLQSANTGLFKNDRSNCDEFLKLQKKIRDLANQPLFRLNHNLGVICSLLIGDRGTFKKYFALFRPNWFEVFPAFLLFFYPNASGEQIPKIIESFFALLGLNRRQLSKMEQTVLFILELDIIQALRLICSTSNCWFAVHLIDLLHFHDPTFLNPGTANLTISTNKHQPIPTNHSEHDKELANLDLRARLLIEYTQLLFKDNQLWQIAPDYLMSTGYHNAQKLLDQLVGQQNFHENIGTAEILLQICEKFELHTAKEIILKEITMKFCNQNEWSSALGWALRLERGSELAAYVARRILKGAIPATRIGQMRIFESLADQFVDCAEFVLLYKFYTFKRHLIEGDLRQAVQILHELFLDNSSPTEFCIVLVQELCRILVTFQRPLIGADAIESQSTNAVPGLDRDSIQDIFRALSMFQMKQNLLKAAAAGEKEQQEKKQRLGGSNFGGNTLFSDSKLPSMDVYGQLAELMKTLRPLLAEAMASCSLH